MVSDLGYIRVWGDSRLYVSLCVCFVCVTIILCVCLCFCVFFRRLCANLALCWMFRSRSAEGLVSVTAGGYFRRTARFVSLFLSLSPSLSFCYYIKFYSDSDSATTCNSPFSYRQPYGNGQLLSRRYCRHSGWLFSCALRTAQESQGHLAVSCKYFKQSKWPYLAANRHGTSLYLLYLRSTRYSSM